MMTKRPQWAEKTPEMQNYYDNYWGFPVHDDYLLFEMLSLELFQAGLTWQTIWHRRLAFEDAFLGFNVEKVAAMTEKDVERLCANAKIIRNRRKILAVINNARVICQLRENGTTFNDYIWQFMNGKAERLILSAGEDLPAQTPASQRLSKQMRNDGFKFVGPTIIYSFMTAVGMVNARLE
ncbi:DNA-3-methyladenine glycosylase I [Limosilactobacillus walteri]|uniref:DNA-3-methyladenine glycosylase I n=1 Tax=Limosilactobacillus walteri TaxID=2268022 RepID=A0ABR8P5Q4_9LACO|nr:DNA-3-methyladenine glycosylase I [Limosilactobacillus walteri]